MAKEAESHAEEDRERKDAVEARNMLDGAVYQAEKMVKDNKDKLSDADAKTLNEAIDEAKKTVKDEKATKDALEEAAKKLSDIMMPIGAKMYEDQNQAEAESSDKKTDKEEPIEGEVLDEEKKDEEK